MKSFEEAFGKLIEDGKNSVDGIIAWLKETKLIDESQAAEEKARKLFDGVADQANVELSKFNEVVGKLAAEQNKSMEQFTKMLTETGPRIMGAVTAGVSAFKDAFTKK